VSVNGTLYGVFGSESAGPRDLSAPTSPNAREGSEIDFTIYEMMEETGPIEVVISPAGPLSICAGTSAPLVATPTDPNADYDYQWTAPAGIALSGANTPTVMVTPGGSVSGPQELTLTVSDGTSILELTTILFVKTPPVFSFNVLGQGSQISQVPGCSASTSTLLILGENEYVFTGPVGGPTGISRQFGGSDNAFPGNGFRVRRQPLPGRGWAVVNQPGQYQVTVTAPNGCVTSASLTLPAVGCP
jgi:hypothetical protein